MRYASEYDRSHAAVMVAAAARDRAYANVKPAIDALRTTEPYLSSNHLFYVAEFERLQRSPDPKIEVFRFQRSGTVLDTELGKPVFEPNAVDNVSKSYRLYTGDLKELYKQIDDVDQDIRKIASDTKKITHELTGTDEANKYVKPGLYQLTDGEFKAMSKIKVAIDDIKPHWSKAVEQARLFKFRRDALEATLEKLQGAPKK